MPAQPMMQITVTLPVRPVVEAVVVAQPEVGVAVELAAPEPTAEVAVRLASPAQHSSDSQGPAS